METEKSGKKVMEFVRVATLDSNVHGKELSQLILVPENRHFLFYLQTKEATNNVSHSANMQQKLIMFVSNNREIMYLVYWLTEYVH